MCGCALFVILQSRGRKLLLQVYDLSRTFRRDEAVI